MPKSNDVLLIDVQHAMDRDEKVIDEKSLSELRTLKEQGTRVVLNVGGRPIVDADGKPDAGTFETLGNATDFEIIGDNGAHHYDGSGDITNGTKCEEFSEEQTQEFNKISKLIEDASKKPEFEDLQNRVKDKGFDVYYGYNKGQLYWNSPGLDEAAKKDVELKPLNRKFNLMVKSCINEALEKTDNPSLKMESYDCGANMFISSDEPSKKVARIIENTTAPNANVTLSTHVADQNPSMANDLSAKFKVNNVKNLDEFKKQKQVQNLAFKDKGNGR